MLVHTCVSHGPQHIPKAGLAMLLAVLADPAAVCAMIQIQVDTPVCTTARTTVEDMGVPPAALVLLKSDHMQNNGSCCMTVVV